MQTLVKFLLIIEKYLQLMWGQLETNLEIEWCHGILRYLMAARW